MRIVVVGAGASSLFVAYKLQKDFKDISLTLYEKNPAVAGSWYENWDLGYVFSLRSCHIDEDSRIIEKSQMCM